MPSYHRESFNMVLCSNDFDCFCFCVCVTITAVPQSPAPKSSNMRFAAKQTFSRFASKPNSFCAQGFEANKSSNMIQNRTCVLPISSGIYILCQGTGFVLPYRNKKPATREEWHHDTPKDQSHYHKAGPLSD